jgi:hypothetical protein
VPLLDDRVLMSSAVPNPRAGIEMVHHVDGVPNRVTPQDYAPVSESGQVIEKRMHQGMSQGRD